MKNVIENMAFLETLKAKDAKMKAKYTNHFPDDISHIDKLPLNIFHYIKLKDSNVTITRHQYNCPKKYRDAFQVLL